jgi:hypothetical protein
VSEVEGFRTTVEVLCYLFARKWKGGARDGIFYVRTYDEDGRVRYKKISELNLERADVDEVGAEQVMFNRLLLIAGID